MKQILIFTNKESLSNVMPTKGGDSLKFFNIEQLQDKKIMVLNGNVLSYKLGEKPRIILIYDEIGIDDFTCRFSKIKGDEIYVLYHKKLDRETPKPLFKMDILTEIDAIFKKEGQHISAIDMGYFDFINIIQAIFKDNKKDFSTANTFEFSEAEIDRVVSAVFSIFRALDESLSFLEKSYTNSQTYDKVEELKKIVFFANKSEEIDSCYKEFTGIAEYGCEKLDSLTKFRNILYEDFPFNLIK